MAGLDDLSPPLIANRGEIAVRGRGDGATARLRTSGCSRPRMPRRCTSTASAGGSDRLLPDDRRPARSRPARRREGDSPRLRLLEREPRFRACGGRSRDHLGRSAPGRDRADGRQGPREGGSPPRPAFRPFPPARTAASRSSSRRSRAAGARECGSSARPLSWPRRPPPPSARRRVHSGMTG